MTPTDLQGPEVTDVDLGPGVGAWTTGRAPDVPPVVGEAGNLSHRRPHEPARLAADRAAFARRVGIDASALVLMHQVHGPDVAVVDGTTPAGAEVRGVDALVTAEPDRPLGVQVADCVPVLLAAHDHDGRAVAVGVAHAGRAGLAAGVVDAAVRALREVGGADARLRAALGPAIGGCCYEVPAALRDEVDAQVPGSAGTTTWGTPALDLPAGVRRRLDELDVDHAGTAGPCTRCHADRFFSHRADANAGRQLGVVVLRGAP
ncbi:MAG: polyphenol oxidase family protein [Actinomycetes bacterium]